MVSLMFLAFAINFNLLKEVQMEQFLVQDLDLQNFRVLDLHQSLDLLHSLEHHRSFVRLCYPADCCRMGQHRNLINYRSLGQLHNQIDRHSLVQSWKSRPRF
jgi:hypothetical protein